MLNPVIINERDGTRFEQAPGDTLLRAALRAGVGLSYECNSGGCGGCKFELLAGDIETLWPAAPGLGERDRRRGRHLACQCRALGPVRIKAPGGPEYVPRIRPARQTARLAELTEVASSLAHELNQPLMAITSYSDACLRLLENPRFEHGELVTAMQKSRDQAVRAGRIIARIRSFIRSRRPEPSRFDINELLLESIELLEVARDEHAIRTELRLTPNPLIAHADRTLMAQVIHNLLQNAIDAMQTIPIDQRRLSITTDRAPDGGIALTFADSGPGIPDYLAESAYTALFSTKEKGLGLGLSICRSVIEAHGGRIWHENSPTSGCIFHLTLPAETTEGMEDAK